ncbi:Heterokaryon incompatibility [Macrophomina phaseolina MS6]|uniref:Heterokaryon incompatibility n=1 Tax=Macrophomina phaseolina (strain MS6) TaxID=1126212 RepID=K2T0P4_MACPH|nr:Heterokaryon incompatibility [Macrophomina phaseolina MS6]
MSDNGVGPEEAANEPLWHLIQSICFENNDDNSNPPALVKLPRFDTEWDIVPDANGPFRDDCNRRVRVANRFVTDDDLACSRYGAACIVFFVWIKFLSMPTLQEGTPPSIVWRRLDHVWGRLKPEIQPHVRNELSKLKAQDEIGQTDPNPSDAFRYFPLESDPTAIRVVVLLPSQKRYSDIRCYLCNTALSRNPAYEALSYVWAEIPGKRPIRVEHPQHSQTQTFWATANLESALRHLRQPDRIRVIWIDALCINQEDIGERTQQVKQMDKIYQKAKEVIVWLGPESDTSREAMDFMANARPSESRFDGSGGKSYVDFLKTKFAGVYRLFSRLWWTRVWCVQEILLAQSVTVQCGDSKVPWKSFSAAFDVIIQHSALFYSLKDPVKIARRLLNAGHTLEGAEAMTRAMILSQLSDKGNESKKITDLGVSALGILMLFRHRSAGDPRDRVFAFRGLLGPEHTDLDCFNPDYSATTAEVYTLFAVNYIRIHRNLSILSVSTIPGTDFLNLAPFHALPSWIPDWRDHERHGYAEGYLLLALQSFSPSPTVMLTESKPLYNASFGRETEQPIFHCEYQVLEVEGIVVDAMDGVAEQWSLIPAENIERFQTWKDMALGLGRSVYEATQQTIDEVLWRTICADQHIDGDELDLQQRKRLASEPSGLQWASEFPPSAEEEAASVKGLCNFILPALGRTLFRSARGLIGLAPVSAKAGDLVVVLYGATVPFILRKFGDYYHVVGESYVHGIMDGEAIHRPKMEWLQGAEERKFKLA